MKKLLIIGLLSCFNLEAQIQNILPSYTAPGNTFTQTIIGSIGQGVLTPRDLDFHPTTGDLWVINQGTERTGGRSVKFTNPGQSGQTSLLQKDPNSWHFMSLPSAMAFGPNGNWATSTSVYDANHNGGAPFTGPSLWSSDPLIYAQPPGPGKNGSHLDMLHVSPHCMGIASDTGNVYWVFDKNSNDIVRYDFKEDHGPGNSYHGDGVVWRYPEIQVDWININTSSHLVLDRNHKWLYIVDGGNKRILRMDITTGTLGGTPTFRSLETLAQYTNVTGVTWEVVASTGLVEPVGIDILDNTLVVSDRSNGDLLFYNLWNRPATLIGKHKTGDPGIQGIKIGPQGRIWYANTTKNKIVKIEPNQITLGIDEEKKALSLQVYPNPSTGLVNLKLDELSIIDANVNVTDVTGKVLLRKTLNDASDSQLDLAHLANGIYFLTVNHSEGSLTKKIVLEH